ncbi:hypothetical protein GCM10009609_69080 [Pseudonocardia aurantiaca]|uniref:Uncharacterized protein n=1 Tax=Pseudonocardia aurantiaca TaxID=75290 RepID=A0ABW4FPH6_9PSEU
MSFTAGQRPFGANKQLCKRRAPDGFGRLEDVIDAAELEAVVSGYAKATGARKP